mmetsp:Transcript_39065/g.102910  ORF Transcript_39065/g.102910 Transcript_39065/m.102910 type:complete len:253 (-) Transcript_39065:67-825(-)
MERSNSSPRRARLLVNCWSGNDADCRTGNILAAGRDSRAPSAHGLYHHEALASPLRLAESTIPAHMMHLLCIQGHSLSLDRINPVLLRLALGRRSELSRQLLEAVRHRLRFPRRYRTVLVASDFSMHQVKFAIGGDSSTCRTKTSCRQSGHAKAMGVLACNWPTREQAKSSPGSAAGMAGIRRLRTARLHRFIRRARLARRGIDCGILLFLRWWQVSNCSRYQEACLFSSHLLRCTVYATTRRSHDSSRRPY